MKKKLFLVNFCDFFQLLEIEKKKGIIIIKKNKIKFSAESMEFGYCPNCIARQFCIAM